MMEEGHKTTANSKDSITLEKNGCVIKFDMRVETPKGVLWSCISREMTLVVNWLRD